METKLLLFLIKQRLKKKLFCSRSEIKCFHTKKTENGRFQSFEGKSLMVKPDAGQGTRKISTPVEVFIIERFL